MGLENLPLELKDQVYNYVIRESYCFHRRVYWHGCFHKYHVDGYSSVYELSRHAIFLTSKRIRHEALEVCFSKNELCWNLYFWADKSFSQSTIDRPMNIQLVLDMEEHNHQCSWDEDSDPSSQENMKIRFDRLKIFGGADVLRNQFADQVRGMLIIHTSNYMNNILPNVDNIDRISDCDYRDLEVYRSSRRAVAGSR